MTSRRTVHANPEMKSENWELHTSGQNESSWFKDTVQPVKFEKWIQKMPKSFSLKWIINIPKSDYLLLNLLLHFIINNTVRKKAYGVCRR